MYIEFKIKTACGRRRTRWGQQPSLSLLSLWNSGESRQFANFKRKPSGNAHFTGFKSSQGYVVYSKTFSVIHEYNNDCVDILFYDVHSYVVALWVNLGLDQNLFLMVW